jgi:ribose 5-phosphate isomerase B
MRIAIGADHAGFPVKSEIVALIEGAGHSVIDMGAFDEKPSDYPDFARAVGRAVAGGEADRGVLLCGSGVGVSVAANKMHGIRAGLCHETYSAHQSVEHDNVNVLCLGPRVVGIAVMREVVLAFLNARFSGEERHCRRLEKVTELEELGE